MIYIITDDSGYVKIGKTNNTSMKNRLKQLQCGNPRNLRVLKTIQIDRFESERIRIYLGELKRVARTCDIEKALHEEYRDYMAKNDSNVTSEWFREECVKDLLVMNDEEVKAYLTEVVTRHIKY